MIIGLTGGIGSGKSTVSRYLSELGCIIVDADRISHNITGQGAPILKDIQQMFGEDLVDAEGNLQRKKLGELVFSDKEKLKKLNELITGKILEEALTEIERVKETYPYNHLVFDVPLLFESGWSKYCDICWTVSCSEEIRIKRVAERDGLSEESVRSRMKSQFSDSQREKLADVVIFNNGGLEELYRAIETNLP